MDNNIVFILSIIFGIGLIVFLIIFILCRILINPFRYPYFTYKFDVTSKRNVQIEDYIDRFLCDTDNWHQLCVHVQHIKKWKEDTLHSIEAGSLKNHRMKQFLSIIDDKHSFRFSTIRMQTRYRQHNYVKTAYKVPATDTTLSVDWEWLVNRHNQLESIGFESTLNDFNSKNQRRLMTPSLRKKIMIRDNYTCQICGKYMPDEVGLHIDHIMPIARGGKTIESNLRVLCSKCNGSKGSKVPYTHIF